MVISHTWGNGFTPVQMESMEGQRLDDSTADKGLQEADLSSRADELESRIVAVEAATGVASEDVRTCIDANRGIESDILDLKNRVGTVEEERTGSSQLPGLEELQKAVWLLTDSVDAKADRSQVEFLEGKLGASEIADSGHSASTESVQAVSEKLEQLACKVSQVDEKAEDTAAAVIRLSSEVRDVSQQAVCIKVWHLPATYAWLSGCAMALQCMYVAETETLRFNCRKASIATWIAVQSCMTKSPSCHTSWRRSLTRLRLQRQLRQTAVCQNGPQNLLWTILRTLVASIAALKTSKLNLFPKQNALNSWSSSNRLGRMRRCSRLPTP